MKMTRIEKRFVNRRKKSERNIKILEPDLQQIDLAKIRSVLELGCGIGFVSAYLTDRYNFNVFGTDFDQEQIEIARKIQNPHEHLHFQIEDATQLSFDDESMDLVLSQNVFHHIPEWEAAIKEIVRVLRFGGYFIWLDLTLPQIIKKIFLPFVKNYGLYTINDIKTAFKKYGLKALSHEQVAHGPLNQHHFMFHKSTKLT